MFIASKIATRWNQNFINLPLIAAIPLCLLVPLLIFGYLPAATIDHDRAFNEKIEKFENKFKTVKRDFLCDDGTFFNINIQTSKPKNGTVPTTLILLEYYPLVDTFTKKPSYEWPPWRVGLIVKGHLYVEGFADSGEGYNTIMAKLSSCKNSEGKSVMDVYPLLKI